MKRQRSYSEDLAEGEKDWGGGGGRRDSADGTKMRSLKGLESSSSYKKSGASSRNFEGDGRSVRKRPEVEAEGFDRSSRDAYGGGGGRVSSSCSSRRGEREGSRKGGLGFDRGEVSRSSRGDYNRDRERDACSSGSPRRILHSAERTRRSGSKRESYDNLKFIGKGFRSERDRDRSRSYGSEGANGPGGGAGPLGWKRSDDYYHRSGRGSEMTASVEDRMNLSAGRSKSPQGSKETEDSVKGADLRKGESNSSSDEMEEGELEPELEPERHQEQEFDGGEEREEKRDSGPEREDESTKVVEEVQQHVGHMEEEEEEAVETKVEYEDDAGHVDGKGRGGESGEELAKEGEFKPNVEREKVTGDDENKIDEDGDKDMKGLEIISAGFDSLANEDRGTNADKGSVNVDDEEANLQEQQPVERNVEEIEKGEGSRQELTFRFMCDVLHKGAVDEVGEPLAKSSSMEEQGEETGSDKDQGLALSLSNGPAVWDERGLQLGNDRKKKAPLEEPLGDNSSRGGFHGELHGALKIEEQSNDNQMQKKAKLEPLQLSLGLPDVSLTLASPSINLVPAPSASPSRGRSFQSLSHTAHTARTQTQTGSDAFTTSISFSGSHPFIHNPSCSLNQNSMDNYEYSVGSHPSLHGNSEQVSHWNATYSNEQASYDNNGLMGGASQESLKQRREVTLYQRILQNGNHLQVPQGVFGASNSREQPSNDRDSMGYERAASNTNVQGNLAMTQGQQVRSLEGSLGTSNSLERQAKVLTFQGHQARSCDGGLSRFNGPERHAVFQRDLPEQWREVRSSPAQSVGSLEKGSDQCKKISRDSGMSDRERTTIPQRGHGRVVEQSVPGGLLNIERVLLDIVSEPITIMCQKLQEMPSKTLEHLREWLGELIGKNEKSEKNFAFQKILQNRTDLTMEVLQQAHRVQLEILVAVKTGIQGFLLPNNPLPSSELAEIFLQLKCRNMACRSALPADDCECKVCTQKTGFCNACMCLVCSKFDFASNTCSWVGCDVCLHWCHTDCGIRMSHIRNGRSIKGAPGTTEMQFHCIACEHDSEMFGFVKEVFKTCAKGWDVETLAKELDCVRRIFQESEDLRGKKLWSQADQALAKLESKMDPSEVCNSLMVFLSDCDAKIIGPSGFVAKDPVQSNQADASNRIPISVREAVYNIPSSSNEKVGTSGSSERVRNVLQSYDREVEGKRTEATELQYNRSRNKAEIDELESIVRIKQAEAKMFQVRADDARREAEGLQRIAIAKNEKIEEEYASKLAKLCLAEVEERRRRKLEELHVLDRSQRDYLNMKMRMEADIQDLLMKMEVTKRRF